MAGGVGRDPDFAHGAMTATGKSANEIGRKVALVTGSAPALAETIVTGAEGVVDGGTVP